jgi:predicted nucleic acid-binding protein
MVYILDTNILLQILRGDSRVTPQLTPFNLYHPDTYALISIVTIAELLSIAQQNNWGSSKMRQLETLIKAFKAVPIDKRVLLDLYAAIDTFSKGKHSTKMLPSDTTARKMGKNDLWIAATAHLFNATLITTDKDFDHLNGTFIQVHKIII